MKIEWLDDPNPDQTAEEALDLAGAAYASLTSSDDHEWYLSQLMELRGYTDRDEIELDPETENLAAICERFIPEHRHEDDEVRFVLEGAGVFDVRSKDDRWIRVTVGPGDSLVVPAGLYHRFYLTEAKTIRCARLFKDDAGWAPIYRAPDPGLVYKWAREEGGVDIRLASEEAADAVVDELYGMTDPLSVTCSGRNRPGEPYVLCVSYLPAPD
jgi:1,2-dihydroxy-3-keto-5-methylthiopentene dioxygenase